MKQVDVRELSEHTNEIIRKVHADQKAIEVTLLGEVIARILPAAGPIDSDKIARILEERRKLAEKVGKLWPDGVSAAEAVKEQRR